MDKVSAECVSIRDPTDMIRRKDEIATCNYIEFNCDTKTAITILPKLPKNVIGIHHGWGITELEDTILLHAFLLSIPSSIVHLRLSLQKISDLAISIILFGMPSIQSLAIVGLTPNIMKHLLTRMDEAPYFGFSHLVVNFLSIDSVDPFVRIIPRLRALTIDDYDAWHADLDRARVADRISRSGQLVMYDYSGDRPITPSTIPPTLRHLIIYNRSDTDGKYFPTLLEALQKPGWSLRTFSLFDGLFDDAGLGTKKMYEAIRPKMREMERLAMYGQIHSLPYPLMDLVLDPDCNLTALKFDTEENEGVFDLLHAIRSSSRITMLDVRRWDSESVCAFENALESKGFQVIQAMLSPRYVARIGRKMHPGLAIEIPWENHIHAIARTLGWRIGNLCLVGKRIKNENFEDVADLPD